MGYKSMGLQELNLTEQLTFNFRGEGAQKKRSRDPRCSPRGNPACRRTFGGRRKAVRDRFYLQGGTGDVLNLTVD